MGKMHILFISSWYPNRSDLTHGIFNRFFAEASSLYNIVSVLHVCSDESMAEEMEVEESREGGMLSYVIYYKKVQSVIPLFSQAQKRKKMISAAETGFQKIIEERGKPDLIHLNVAMPAGILAMHLAKKYNIPYVMSEHWTGYMTEDGNYKGLLQKYYTQKIISGAKTIMPVSHNLEAAMKEHGLDGNYKVVPNVVNTELFRPKEVTEKTGTHFIHISSLDDAQKNVSGILRAFASVYTHNPGISLMIIGHGKDRESLELLAKQLYISSAVEFGGIKSGHELSDCINAAGALVMFSNYETFCLVIPEAFACGKPVITSLVGGIKDYMNSEMGITVPPMNEEKLAAAMQQFINDAHRFDAQKIREFAVTHYSKEIIGKQFDEVYRAAVRQ